ncbi:uncharacterized protein LOC110919383 [Helianthus annuus]|uniref:uncharacterized protein LOC110919383 n=1 Tax=Helianthus annuus TaxID=4232 RepID=UPI000B9058D8|nr:uncharacterized protein LOC110919383 [Helianthus annuus]
METHVDASNVSNICKKVCNKWKWATNANCCPRGTRIMVGWDENIVDVMILAQTNQVVYTQIVFKLDKKSLFCSFVYAENHYKDRRDLWKDLCQHHSFMRDKPWAIMGDFNATLELDDTLAGSSTTSIATREFMECLIDVFSDAAACFLPYRVSDHTPCILVLPNVQRDKPKPFKFVNLIVDKSGFIEEVNRVWQTDVSGYAMYKVVKKLTLLKGPLRKLLFDQGNLHENVKNTRKRMEECQYELDRSPGNGELMTKLDSMLQMYKQAVQDEALFLQQKSKVDWLSLGDSNTKYFHNVVFESNDVPLALVEHYSNFFGSEVETPVHPTPDLFVQRLSDAKAQNMVRQVSDAEIKAAMFSISGNKAPGPDGYTSIFFKRSWDIVGQEGDPKSVRVIMGALNSFKNMSGLVPSMLKSTVFFGNVVDSVKARILDIMPFEEGVLPVKYLGVPLITTRLNYKDCKCLVEKMEARITDWKAKCLSFAGRLQLIRSVLSSSHVYWASVFILPKRIIHELEERMRIFLWTQGNRIKGKVKVKWKAVCLPRDEGGLGIRRVGDMNNTLMVTHIWSLLTNRESLWVKWIHSYRIRYRNFWDVPIKSNITWSWRKMLNLRPCIRDHIRIKMGDGKNTSAWFDKWDAVCPISRFITPRSIANAGLSMNARVAVIFANGEWVWPESWFNRYPLLNNL